MESEKYVVFQAGKQQYGIPVSSVSSIEKMLDLTKLPQVPDYMSGITNVRGKVIPVLDIAKILFNQPFKKSNSNKIILVNLNDSIVGIIVEDAKEIVDVLSEDINEVNGLVTANVTYLSGVIQTDTGFVTLLNLEKLVVNLGDIESIREQMEQLTT
ncbi:purine-binding chemotaxis protein CheW [Peribacillus saganii]|uniref:Purine-binding chemotaxis protein CheW n=1 Tax=Peribacillus saganii TaxID=2303992 RepID=A0A372LN89_9BACI|nr:chemotaxis protein CheW [Peribacillus saganii]RFU68980.1 purine-binding chemotaxis protein CheW [Peribacillus saganii]